ncbi:MAG: NTP transferase domain-containing protein [Geopsychrobacter sp.]|nr:NTP transferase domain-containing protein [Geopsychrobacter sp.]
MQALVLVGGIGSRLGSLVQNIPKPCLDVAGQPFVSYLLAQLVTAGISQVILLAGYRAEVVQALFPTDSFFDGKLKLEVIVETEPLGTGGALRHVAPLLQDRFLLLNGDSYFNFDLNGFLEDGQRQSAECFMALRRVEDGTRYGEVALSEGYVTHFVEKCPVGKNVLINAGLYWCRKSFLQGLPEGASSLERDLFPQLVTLGKLAAAEYQGDFIDIGVPEDFRRAEAFIRKLERNLK